jgi:hypothetical protein
MGSSVPKFSMNCRKWALAFVFLAPFSTQAQQPPSPSTQQQMTVPPVIGQRVDEKTVEIRPSLVTVEPQTYFSSPFLQKDLKLGMDYNYQLNFNLKANRPNGKAAKIPDGWYLMTATVIFKDTSQLANWPQPETPYDRFVTSAPPALVQVTNGAPAKSAIPLRMRFENVSATAMNHELLIELLPLKPTCNPRGQAARPCVVQKENGDPDPARSDASQLLPGYKPYRVRMAFVPFLARAGAVSELESAPNFLGDQTLASWTVEARQRASRKRMENRISTPTPEQYAGDNRLYYMDLSDPALEGTAKKLLKNTTAAALIGQIFKTSALGSMSVPREQYGKLMTLFCEMLFERNPQAASLLKAGEYAYVPVWQQMKACEYFPEKSGLHLTRVIHVGKLDTSKKFSKTLNTSLNYAISSNFITGRSRSTDTWMAASPVQPITKLLDSFGIPTFGFNYIVSTTNSRLKIEQGITTLTSNMDFNPLGLRMATVNSRQCLMVTVDPSGASMFYNSVKDAKNGLYICGGVEDQLTVEEIYAHVYTRGQDTSLTQAYDPGTQSLNQSLRGDRDLSALMYNIRAAMTPVHGPELFPSSFAASAQNYFNQTPAMAPGIIVNAVHLEGSAIPSVVEYALGIYKEKFIGDQAGQ